jgi:hypothetical protein
MTDMRSQSVRFTVSAQKRPQELVQIHDDDFHWDAALRVSGDFENFDEKKRYAHAVAQALNAAEASIPVRPQPEHTVGGDANEDETKS